MDRRKILILVVTVVVIIVSVITGVRLMGPVLGAYWHAAFPSNAPPPDAPTPSPPVADPTTARPDTPPPSTATSEAAARALADVEAELTPEKVSADPLGAIKRYSKIVSDYPGTAAADRARELMRPLEQQTKDSLGKANAEALEEIARVRREVQPKLDRLEHRSVVLIWREEEEKFAGLPAAQRCAEERDKVQKAWDAMPKAELDAAKLFQALPPEPKVAEDAAKRLEIASGADAITMRYGQTKFAEFAARYRDEQLDKFCAALEEIGARSPDAARQLGAKFPEVFQDTDQAKRVKEILAKLK